IYDPAREGDLFNRRSECCRGTNRFDDHIWPPPICHFQQPIMEAILCAVDRVRTACAPSEVELFVVHIDTDLASAARTGPSDCTQSNSSTAEHCHGVLCLHPPSRSFCQ